MPRFAVPRDAHRWWRALPVVGLFLAVSVAVFGERGVLHNRVLAEQIRAEQDATERLRAQNEEYRRQILALTGDPAAIERRAREEFDMVREGEIVFEFIDSGAPHTGASDSAARAPGRR